MQKRVVIDTNVLVAGLIGGKGPNREILKLCFQGKLQPFVGNSLYLEYQDLLGRPHIQALCEKTSTTLTQFLDDFASICRPIDARYLWRPNLRDEADNHIVELAIAAQADFIITNNTSDFSQAGLARFGYAVITPENMLRLLRS